MQFSLAVLSLAAFAMAKEATVTVTDSASVTVTPSAEVVSIYTNSEGEEATSTITSLPLSKAKADYSSITGVLVTTIGPEHPATTVTTTTGTHKYGKFDHTKKSSQSSSSGTHKYGRFDHTQKASKSSSTGTHKYGRFDKTKQGTATAVMKAESSNAANQLNAAGLGAVGLVAALLAC